MNDDITISGPPVPAPAHLMRAQLQKAETELRGEHEAEGLRVERLLAEAARRAREVAIAEAVTRIACSFGAMSDSEFWYCIKHSRVEGHDGCPNKDRLGPYATEAEASRALETAAERTEAWDKESDSGWDDEQLED